MTTISPYTLRIDDADLTALRSRLDATRWPQEIEGVGWEYGVEGQYMRELTEYWRASYDWRANESRINQVPGYITEIDGQRVHFLRAGMGTPLLLTHGWPTSLVEFLDVIEPLCRHGFEVIVPSLPGFGLSGPTYERGWDVPRIAHAWAELMQRLGHRRYILHGADFGAAVSHALGRLHPERVMGVHLVELLSAIAETPDEDARSFELRERFQRDLSGYLYVHTQRPQTLAFALADSPVGQLAWIAERFRDWTAGRTPDETVGRDALLTNVMLYWLTGTAASSSRIYREHRLQWGAEATRGTVPTGFAVTPANISRPVRSMAERSENVVHWTELSAGGHFPALEVPELLVADILRFAAVVS